MFRSFAKFNKSTLSLLSVMALYDSLKLTLKLSRKLEIHKKGINYFVKTWSNVWSVCQWVAGINNKR
jgi:hypothetical protein